MPEQHKVAWMYRRIQPTDACSCTSTLMCHHQQGICLLKIDCWQSMKLMALASPCCYGNVSRKSGDYASLVQAQNLVSRKSNEVFCNNTRHPKNDRVRVHRGSFSVWNRRLGQAVSLELSCLAQSLWNNDTGRSEEHNSSISSLDWVVSMHLCNWPKLGSWDFVF